MHERHGKPAARPRLRILVAGAAGFIGSHLCEHLLARGDHVIGVDNLVTGHWDNLEPLVRHPRFTFHLHDVVSPLPISTRLDWVLHFASPASPPRYREHPIETLRSNGEGTWCLLSLAHRSGASFLLASTSEVYGDPLVHPQREDDWGHVNPIGPRSVYDEGKRYAEAMTMAFHRRHGRPVRIVRIFNTYGPRMRPDDGRVVANFAMQALDGEPITVYGDGRQTRSLQYVDDLVAGVTRTMEVDGTGPINLGNPDECTVIELAERVKALTGSDSPIVHRPLPEDDPRRRKPDITLAIERLGWRPRVSLDDGLARTIAWLREFRAAAGARAVNGVGMRAARPRVALSRPRRAAGAARAGGPAPWTLSVDPRRGLAGVATRVGESRA